MRGREGGRGRGEERAGGGEVVAICDPISCDRNAYSCDRSYDPIPRSHCDRGSAISVGSLARVPRPGKCACEEAGGHLGMFSDGRAPPEKTEIEGTKTRDQDVLSSGRVQGAQAPQRLPGR